MEKNSSESSKKWWLHLDKLYNDEQIWTLVDIFPDQLRADITSWIADQLIKAIEKEGYHFSSKDILENADRGYLRARLREYPSELESVLLYAYNRNFWNTHIKDWNKLKDLKLHTPWEAQQNWMEVWKRKDFWKLEPIITKYGRKLNSLFKDTFWFWFQDAIDKYYKPQLLEMSEVEEAMIEEILLWLEHGDKYFIILNHDTFANIPLAILKFMRKAEELWIKNVNRFFTTVIGPLLNTHKLQNMTINSLSNVIITHPAGNQIQELKPLISLQQKWAISQMLKDFKDDWEGKIYFCAPSGTRDVVIYWKDSNWNPTTRIYLPDESRGSNISTINMINKLRKNNPNIKTFALSTNTTALKQGISPNDNTWNKNAEISMHLQELPQKKPLNASDVVTTLAKWIKTPIKDENWEIIWEQDIAMTVPEDVFRLFKKRSKTGDYPYGIFDEEWNIDEYLLNNWVENNKNEF